MIELTVALPMFRSKPIAWLALESLCRQTDIDFEWELIIIEETDPAHLPFGKNEILIYKDRLEKVGCKRIEYIGTEGWIPLSKKWRLMAENCSDSSEVFLLQAADCFSFPKRLSETYDIIIKQDFDYVSSEIGLFYDIKTNITYLYNTEKLEVISGLNMGIKTKYIKNLPDVSKKAGIDHWIVNCMREMNPDFKYTHNNSINAMYGVDTHGLNNISKSRRKLLNSRLDIFPKRVNKLRKYIPMDILIKLKSYQPYAR